MVTLGYSGFTRDSRSGDGYRSPLGKTGQDFTALFEFRDGEVPFSYFPLGYFGHDASAALLRDGQVVACAAEERFTRVKYSLNLAGNTLLPKHAIAYCLRAAGITMDEVDTVAHYCHFTLPLVKRRAELLAPFMPPGQLQKVLGSYEALYERMLSGEVVREQFTRMTGRIPRRFVRIRHHEAHAASAFYPSGLDRALVLTLDGTGELESSMLAVAGGNGITELRSAPIPVSLGALYLILTVYLGFKSLGDEYKVMGLASYGDPSRYRPVFDELVTCGAEGTYDTPWLARLELKEFLLSRLGPSRKPDQPFEQRHADVAASLQEALQKAVLHTLRHARAETGLHDLCMAGGVALNCALNGAIARSGLFRMIYVQPASSDEGCSLGAAYAACHRTRASVRGTPSIRGTDSVRSTARAMDDGVHDPLRVSIFWGPCFSDAEILLALGRRSREVAWRRVHPEESGDGAPGIEAAVARELARGKVVGWFQGRMEFGPRALGNRSILADPREASMRERINEKVKRREPFRPFAPAVIEEEASAYFDMSGLDASPFMLFAVPVLSEVRDRIPAVTHVDGTARVQTVSRTRDRRFWTLLHEFKKVAGIPVLLNTSFNVKNEPIVCTPEDAVCCFLSTDIDLLAIGDYLVEKRPAGDQSAEDRP